MEKEKNFFVSLRDKTIKKSFKKKSDEKINEKRLLTDDKTENEWFQEYDVIYQSYILES